MKASRPGLEPEAELLAAHLHVRAAAYFEWAAAAPPEVTLRSSVARPAARLYRFAVSSGREEREVLVKVPFEREATERAATERADTPKGPERPRLVSPVERSRKYSLEHRALSTIHSHFSQIADPRFGTVRALDVLPAQRALIMDAVAEPNLRDLFIRSSFRPGSTRGAGLEDAFRNAGAWLSRYHAIPEAHEAEPRHAHRDDFVAFVSRLCEFLGGRLADEPFFEQVRESCALLAEAVLPENLPLGLGHGDFAPRNVLVAKDRRVTILDTLGRFRSPIYEDIGYFQAALRSTWPAVVFRGAITPRSRLARYEKAFLDGYFEKDVPFEAVRLYEVQAMLDRWASVVAAAERVTRIRTRFQRRGRAAVLAWHFRREIRARLRPHRPAEPAPGRTTDDPGPSEGPLDARTSRSGRTSRGARTSRSAPTSRGARTAPSARTPAGGVAYIMSRFPKLTETFVLYEMLALESAGVGVEVYPLLRERQPVSHPEAERWVRRAHFLPFISPSIVRAHLHFLRRAPSVYLGLLPDVLRRTWGSPNFVLGAIGIFPKVVAFARDMEARGVAHVHAHFATHPALAGFIIHRLTGISFSFTAHGSDLHVDRRMLDAKVAEAAFAVTVSDYNRELMVATCGEAAREKIHVVHCGVDTELFRPDPDRVDGPELRILCVASLEEVKGHRYLVESLALLKARRVPFRCDLVGDGPLRREVAARIEEHGLRDSVHLRGPSPRAEVVGMLRKADVAVLTSHPTRDGKREGIPVALMEAMACGLPVVASAISGIPELVESGHTGFLVPSGDPVAVADALEWLAGDRDLGRRMGAAGRKKVLRDFDLETGASALMKLITEEGPGREPREPSSTQSRSLEC